MTEVDDKDDLLGLFSTRKTPPTSSEAKQSQSSQSQSRTSTPTSENKDSGGMSTLVKTIMKDARRELGVSKESDVDEDEDISEDRISQAIDRVCQQQGFSINDVTRSSIIVHLKKDLMGWGVLQPLIDNPEVTDIQCYDYRTVVLQRGKMSETTGLSWPSEDSYITFIDRLLFRLGKSLSHQQHTVDGAFSDGKRICAVHKSVCGSRGPILTIRVPRISEVTLDSLLSYKVAPPLIINYLAALTRTCEHTFIVSGETGTGKTTLMRCLGTQFRSDESIIGVEDTPELNYQHPYYRSLVSRSPNIEGKGEVTLQEHIKTTLRLCPSRVILGEMRSPEAAEAFLEAAQTGHAGMSTVHARNARETLTRLEALLGRVQRGVNVGIIRQQIALALSLVIWNVREKSSGRIRVAQIVEIGNFVEGNIQIKPMFQLVKEGEDPQWEVQSWSSNYESVLSQNGIALGSAPKYMGF